MATPTISFSRTSASTVSFTASGLTLAHSYVIQVYGNGQWWNRNSFTSVTTKSGSFSVDTENSYSARLYDNTYSTVVATGIIPAWKTTTTIYIYARCGTGVSEISVTTDQGYLSVTSTSYKSIAATSGSSVTIAGISIKNGYTTPFILYYNTSSSGSSLAGSYTFSSSTTIQETSYSRYFEVAATGQTYPYTTTVYVDGKLATSSNNTTNTASSVRVSSLSLYGNYASTYDFQYATVNSGTTQYTASSSISLTAGTTTRIYLYFTTKVTSVAPVISSVSTSSTTATIYWSKNGGTTGSWLLYYGTSSSSMQSAGSISSSPFTLSGLVAGRTYIFYVRNYVSSSDYKDSSSVTASTRSSIAAFSWTSNDSVYIASGQSTTNLTASAWNNLISKISSCGGNTGSIPTASSGSTITANHFNQMRNAIASLSGAGSVASSVTSGTTIFYATLFANTSTALKEAINRAISTRNSS